jgi:hypothetical protein
MATKKNPNPESAEETPKIPELQHSPDGRVLRLDAAGDPILPKEAGGRWIGNTRAG